MRTCRRSRISLSPVYIESVANALADALSRTVENRATLLHSAWSHSLHKLGYSRLVDFRSFRPGTLLPRDPHPLLALPPWHLIPPLLLALAKRKGPSAAIVPLWPAQPWWSLIHRLPHPLHLFRLPQPFQSKHWDGLMILCGQSPSALQLRRLAALGAVAVW